MYLAIVFLPLIGAVLAGLIALAGARARHPGGSPPRGAEDHAAGAVPEGHARMPRRQSTATIPSFITTTPKRTRLRRPPAARVRPS